MGYFSKKKKEKKDAKKKKNLDGFQRKYSMVEKKTLVLLLAVKFCVVYISSSSFI